jgi:hypothetical protein
LAEEDPDGGALALDLAGLYCAAPVSAIESSG